MLKFNERDIRLYKNLDFKVTDEFIGKTVDGEKEFIAIRFIKTKEKRLN